MWEDEPTSPFPALVSYQVMLLDSDMKMVYPSCYYTVWVRKKPPIFKSFHSCFHSVGGPHGGAMLGKSPQERDASDRNLDGSSGARGTNVPT